MRTTRRIIAAVIGFGASCSLASGFVPGNRFANFPIEDVALFRFLVPIDISSADVIEHAATGPAIILSFLFQQTDAAEARGIFWFGLLAGGGGIGAGIVQIPRILDELSGIRALQGGGPTEGGDAVDLGPLSGLVYPSPTDKDMAKVFDKAPSAETINKQSTSTNYFATVGYVVEEDFFKVTKGCNPLAVRVAFDSLSGGKGGAISPIEYNEKLENWKGDGGIAALVADLQGAAAIRLSSYAALIFLIVLVGDFIVESGIDGFLSQ